MVAEFQGSVLSFTESYMRYIATESIVMSVRVSFPVAIRDRIFLSTI